MKYKGYTGTVEYSEEDGCLFGRLIGVNDLISYEGESVTEIRQAFQKAVDDYLVDCSAVGKQPDKPYSGKFILCLGPELHARLATRALEEGKSLNQYAGVTILSKNSRDVMNHVEAVQSMAQRLKAECDGTPEDFIRLARAVGLRDDKKIAAFLDEVFIPPMSDARMGALLPAFSGTVISYEGKRTRGKRLRGKK